MLEKTMHVIADAERQLGASFPLAYAEMMRGHNGGEIPTEDDLWELYPLPGGLETRAHQPSGDVVSETLALRRNPLFPPGAVAIADNGLGDQLIFLRIGELLGPGCYFWHHQSGELSIIAEDFSSLERVL